jgi:hypothetical protein
MKRFGLVEMYVNSTGCESRVVLSSILHRIKYGGNRSVQDLFDFELPEAIKADDLLKYCILATCIQHACVKYRYSIPEWVLDKRLFMKEPYFGVDKEYFFDAPQACYDHNVFIDKCSMEAI